MCKVYSISDEEFKSLIKNSHTYTEILLSLGLVPKGGTSSKKLKIRISELDCDTSHFIQRGSWVPKQDLKEILVRDSAYLNIRSLKKRLKTELSIPQKCNCCGVGDSWNGLPLVLQLDHINGINSDNRLENLRLLCPNCHSQTDTYAGKNK